VRRRAGEAPLYRAYRGTSLIRNTPAGASAAPGSARNLNHEYVLLLGIEKGSYLRGGLVCKAHRPTPQTPQELVQRKAAHATARLEDLKVAQFAKARRRKAALQQVLNPKS